MNQFCIPPLDVFYAKRRYPLCKQMCIFIGLDPYGEACCKAQRLFTLQSTRKNLNFTELVPVFSPLEKLLGFKSNYLPRHRTDVHIDNTKYQRSSLYGRITDWWWTL